jgi:parallel beta-helix repeat protein
MTIIKITETISCVDNHLHITKPNTIITCTTQQTLLYDTITISCSTGFILLHNIKVTNYDTTSGTMHYIHTHGDTHFSHCDIFGSIQIHSGAPILQYNRITGRDISDVTDYTQPDLTKDTRHAGVFITESSTPTIEYNLFEHNFRGIRCENDANPIIRYNTFERNKKSIVMFGRASGVIHNNKIGACGEFGIGLFHNTSTHVCDNIIEDCPMNGMQFTEDTTAHVERNTIRKCGRSGMLIKDACPTVHDNILSECKLYGISIASARGPMVYKNTITENTMGGIIVFQGTGNLCKNEIKYNGGYGGICLVSSTDPIIEENFIHHNNVGIKLYEKCCPLITKNVIIDNTHYGIICLNSPGSKVVYIENNCIGSAGKTDNWRYGNLEGDVELQEVSDHIKCRNNARIPGEKFRNLILEKKSYCDTSIKFKD